ncbi:calcium-binding and coiled-coil domain-containing protein 2-like [Macrobrachium rosenbergii]|uniref:calcium-binding and coiled-coil domain-containing protein 2-like n=1 Tax=Macrobrachium rosenbergii TaxID=79674 RepID=UPI0034D54DB4
MLEDEITGMKAENKRLTKNAAALQRLSDTLNNKGEVAGQLKTELSEMEEQKMQMTKRSRGLESELSHCKTEKENVQFSVRERKEQVGKLSRENGSLQCQLQEKEMKPSQQDNLLQAKGHRLEGMARMASSMDEKNLLLERELGNLQAKNEMLLRDFKNLQMTQEHLARANERLQKRLAGLMSWHEAVGAGLNRTERKLE